jgi:hypothetical protein
MHGAQLVETLRDETFLLFFRYARHQSQATESVEEPLFGVRRIAAEQGWLPVGPLHGTQNMKHFVFVQDLIFVLQVVAVASPRAGADCIHGGTGIFAEARRVDTKTAAMGSRGLNPSRLAGPIASAGGPHWPPLSAGGFVKHQHYPHRCKCPLQHHPPQRRPCSTTVRARED